MRSAALVLRLALPVLKSDNLTDEQHHELEQEKELKLKVPGEAQAAELGLG